MVRILHENLYSYRLAKRCGQGGFWQYNSYRLAVGVEREEVVSQTGFEPATRCLEGSRSIP